jgi:uncharacterized protein involved in exopolysaccharide biosynthesis
VSAIVAGLGTLAGRMSRAARAGYTEGPREETSLLAFFTILLLHRRLIAAFALAGTVIFGALAASKAQLYESHATFAVKGARAPMQLPGGAAALGITLAAYAEFSQSVVFYAELAKAKTIIRAIAGRNYATMNSGGRKVPLAAAFGITARDPQAAAGLAADRLSTRVATSISTRSGMVHIAVDETDPLVAQQIVSAILAELDSWSKLRGHEQAVQERQFIEQRVAEARVELNRAEQAERDFLSANRDYFNSPELTLDYERLAREVETRQELYTSLSQSLDQARIEEVRSPTILNVIETADFPVKPERREALRQTLLGLSAGLLVGIVIAMLRQRVAEKQLA